MDNVLFTWDITQVVLLLFYNLEVVLLISKCYDCNFIYFVNKSYLGFAFVFIKVNFFINLYWDLAETSHNIKHGNSF